MNIVNNIYKYIFFFSLLQNRYLLLQQKVDLLAIKQENLILEKNNINRKIFVFNLRYFMRQKRYFKRIRFMKKLGYKQEFGKYYFSQTIQYFYDQFCMQKRKDLVYRKVNKNYLILNTIILSYIYKKKKFYFIFFFICFFFSSLIPKYTFFDLYDYRKNCYFYKSCVFKKAENKKLIKINYKYFFSVIQQFFFELFQQVIVAEKKKKFCFLLSKYNYFLVKILFFKEHFSFFFDYFSQIYFLMKHIMKTRNIIQESTQLQKMIIKQNFVYDFYRKQKFFYHLLHVFQKKGHLLSSIKLFEKIFFLFKLKYNFNLFYIDCIIQTLHKITFFLRKKKKSGRINYYPHEIPIYLFWVKFYVLFRQSLYKTKNINSYEAIFAEIQTLFFPDTANLSIFKENFDDFLNLALVSRVNFTFGPKKKKWNRKNKITKIFRKKFFFEQGYKKKRKKVIKKTKVKRKKIQLKKKISTTKFNFSRKNKLVTNVKRTKKTQKLSLKKKFTKKKYFSFRKSNRKLKLIPS